MVFKFLFGRRKTPEEMLRETQRDVNRSISDLAILKVNLEKREKDLENDLKKIAKDNDTVLVNILAKDLIRTRKYMKLLILTRTSLHEISLQIETLIAENAIISAKKHLNIAVQNMFILGGLAEHDITMQEYIKQRSKLLGLEDDDKEDAGESDPVTSPSPALDEGDTSNLII